MYQGDRVVDEAVFINFQILLNEAGYSRPGTKRNKKLRPSRPIAVLMLQTNTFHMKYIRELEKFKRNSVKVLGLAVAIILIVD